MNGNASINSDLEELLGMSAKHFPVESIDHPASGLDPHRTDSFLITEEFYHARGNAARILTVDNIPGLMVDHRLDRAARGPRDDRLPARLRLDQHHSESFDVIADRSIGQDEHVALLIRIEQD